MVTAGGYLQAASFSVVKQIGQISYYCVLSFLKERLFTYFVNLEFQKWFGFLFFEKHLSKKRNKNNPQSHIQWSIRDYKQNQYVLYKYTIVFVLSGWILLLSAKQLPGIWKFYIGGSGGIREQMGSMSYIPH